MKKRKDELKAGKWQPIETAPRDGRDLLLACGSATYIGSWRLDYFSESEGEQWFRDDYDDYSTGYASTPLNPSHWIAIPPTPNIEHRRERSELS